VVRRPHFAYCLTHGCPCRAKPHTPLPRSRASENSVSPRNGGGRLRLFLFPTEQGVMLGGVCWKALVALPAMRTKTRAIHRGPFACRFNLTKSQVRIMFKKPDTGGVLKAFTYHGFNRQRTGRRRATIR